MHAKHWFRLSQASIFAALVFALSMSSTAAEAFCVINEVHKDKVQFSTPGVRGFNAEIKKGQPKSCCNWQEPTCNPTGSRTGIVKMTAFLMTGIVDTDVRPLPVGLICLDVEMEAGGTMHALQPSGEKSLAVRVFNANGSQRGEVTCVRSRG
jgi:hypothetical protein